MERYRKIIWPMLAVGTVVLLAIYQLRSQGRIWWCLCGQYYLWAGNIWSKHNSQHLLDPYSFTHILHGMAYYALLRWLLPRLPARWRFLLAIMIEALW